MSLAGPSFTPGFARFTGTAQYITSAPLEQAVNAAIALGRPLLIKGEPVTGKTVLAEHVAAALGLALIRWQIQSTTRAADGLYVYDTVQRLHDSRFGDADVADIKRYIRFGPLGQAFLAVFQGVEVDAIELTDEIEAWLRDPALLRRLSPEERAALEALAPAELRRLLEERLREQKERHEGGNRWVGTGGTSPFGRGGAHPTGIHLGGPVGGRGAVLLAKERRFHDYRDDLTLDVRQIKVALRRLRELRRDGRQDELDLDRTIDRTCRNTGELELSWRPPRRNNVKLLLLMDVGGSMDPHAEVVSQLFSAAAQSKQFRDFHAFYFHNCVYEEVCRDARLRAGLAVDELLSTYGPNYKLVLVGDAMMASWELFHYAGGADYLSRKLLPGIERLRRLAAHFERKVWLNPEPPRFWRHHTLLAIRALFPMFPLTLEGLDDAIQTLVKGKARREVPVGGPAWG